MSDLLANSAFYVAAAIAVLATLQAITQFHAVRALLYLIVSFLAIGVIFFLLGAPFAAALEVITYAGAIMVLFVFVIMMLNLGNASANQERNWLSPGIFTGPSTLVALLLAEWIFVIAKGGGGGATPITIGPEVVGEAMLTRYLLGVELASVLLLAGLIGAYHIGYRKRELT